MKRRAGRWGRRRLLAGGLCATLLLAALLGYAINRQRMGYRLLKTAPDDIPRDQALVRFASALAAPLYTRHCAVCHGTRMHGDPDRGAPNLIDADWLYGSGGIADIEHTIAYGVRSGNPKGRNLAVMPAFARPDSGGREKIDPLTPDQIADVTEFLLSIEGRPANADAAARGALIYSDKGVCYDCHSRDAQGDQAIGAPNLADSIWLYGRGSRAEIMRSIIEGRAGVCPAWAPRLRPVAIRALAVYIHVSAHSNGPG